jgi:hypothetical protein
VRAGPRLRAGDSSAPVSAARLRPCCPQALRQNVRPYLPDLLTQLTSHLNRVATSPLPAGGAGAAGPGLTGGGGLEAGGGKPGSSAYSVVDDRLYVFDAVRRKGLSRLVRRSGGRAGKVRGRGEEDVRAVGLQGRHACEGCGGRCH